MGPMMSSCSVSRHLEDDEKLLRETKIQNAPANHRSSLQRLMEQEPNSRTLGVFPIGLWMHNMLNKEDPSSFREWFISTLGEPPVIADSSQLNASSASMEDYLFNKGYFDASVEPQFQYWNSSVSVNFKVNHGAPYRVESFEYFSINEVIDSLLKRRKDDALIREGDIYDSDKLSRERIEIESYLRNNGFYEFNREFIYYDVDTTRGERKVAIGAGVRHPSAQDEHHQYTIDEVYVDTRFGSVTPEDTTAYEDIKFLGKDLPVEKSVLNDLIMVRPGNLYSQEDVQQTFRQLSAFGVFNYTDIDFEKQSDTSQKLRAHINLRAAPRQEFALESEIMTRERSEEGFNLMSPERFYGLGSNIRYRHKNLRRQGLQFETNVGGLWEAQLGDFLTNYQLRSGASVRFPGILLPGGLRDRLRGTPSNTSINTNYIFENNQNFQRSSGNIGWQYQLNLDNFSHYFTPFQISLVSTSASDEFDEELNEWLQDIEDPFIRDYYDNLYGSRHIIQGMRYSILYNPRQLQADENHWFMRYTVFETSGNLIALLRQLGDDDAGDEPRDEILGVNYYQYAKSEIDIRYNQILGNDRSFIYRLNTGVGVPYGNSDFMPFEKRYFTGGTNSIRGWRVRTLGPGSASPEDAFIDRTGDIKLEINTEYRFPIFGILEGALFVDAGNVWKWDDQEIEGSEFDLGNVPSEMAVASGAGLRLDFDFFIFRLDLGLKAKDPAQEDQWVIRDITDNSYWQEREGLHTENNYNINFGIGYPF